MIVMDVMISCRIVLFAIYNMDCGENMYTEYCGYSFETCKEKETILEIPTCSKKMKEK